ncbi:alpha/beta fold hydrolase [Mastigocoleus sp. MO_188.B34]|uniref:alpha/beta fold hydrolase n=1 Tax=Mastigocoleus sp. MO_188.B34 TaxID=3036635 RepID=UPI002638A1D7|nr:alpha/beta fold hydrolase [Mastigocoleus sp. MO_188.B34]MDJ0692967.1 alpha/beta fold hydrolase [Mastigocoleus sp. MO_188.B34]
MRVTKAVSTEPIPGQYWEWQGHKVYYVNAGAKQTEYPALLLVHGFGASTDHWRKNITELCKEFEVYAIDLLGFGRSAKPNLEYSGDLWRDQLYDFITQVIGQKVVVVGNSLGGYASLSVSAQRQDGVAGVVLLNSAGPFSDNQTSSESESLTQQNEPVNFAKQVQTVFGDTVKWVFQQRLTQFLLFQYIRQPWVIRQTLEKVYLDKSAVTEQLVEEIRRPSGDPGAFDVFCSVFSTRQGETVDELLGKLTSPLLLLWGEGDPWMNAKQRSEKYRQYYPQMTEYFLQAGHCPHDEIPEKVNSLLGDWVKNQVMSKK